MNTTPPLAENAAAKTPDKAFFTTPAAGAFLREAAKELGMHLDEHHGLYDLPMGVKLQRFTGGDHILLVGQFTTDGGSDNARHVYTVEVTRADNTPYQWTWNVEVKEDKRLLVSMTVPGSRCKAEYIGIKALKADLHRRVRRNERRAASKKRRAAAKTETTN